MHACVRARVIIKHLLSNSHQNSKLPAVVSKRNHRRMVVPPTHIVNSVFKKIRPLDHRYLHHTILQSIIGVVDCHFVGFSTTIRPPFDFGFH